MLGVVGDEVRLGLRTLCVSLPSRDGSDGGYHVFRMLSLWGLFLRQDHAEIRMGEQEKAGPMSW